MKTEESGSKSPKTKTATPSLSASLGERIKRRFAPMNILGAALLFLSSMPSAPAAEVDWGSPMGANLQLWLESNRLPEIFSPMMNLAQNSGVRWNRDGFTWHVMEPQQGAWNFDATDEAVLACSQRGMRMIGVLGFGNPAYGYSGVFAAPQTQQQIDAFANYVHTVVDRYKGAVDVWEVWNEPNLPQFLNTGDYLADYVKILSIAAPAIKEANPNAVVLGPATSAEPLVTIQSMINNGSIQYLDAISFHTYTYPASIETTSEPRVVSLQNILDQNNIDKPLIVTEMGFPTHIGGMGLSLERQADLMVRGYATLLANNVKVITGYSFRNLITGTATQWASIERNWGWVWNDLTPKPVLPAMRAMSTLLASRSFSKALPVSTESGGAAPRIKALAFSNAAGRETVVLWSWNEIYDANKQLLQSRSHEVVINGFVKDTTTSERDRLYNLQGYEQPLTSVPGGYALELGPTPIYLTGRDLDHAGIVVQDIGVPPPPAPTEVIVDNTDTGAVSVAGAWTASNATAGHYGANYLHDGNSGKGSKTVTFTPNLPETGDYDVYLRWTESGNRASSVEVDIDSAEGLETVFIDQRSGGDAWAMIGRYQFNAGSDGALTIYNGGTSGYVIADAVRFVKPLVGAPAVSGGSIDPEADAYVWDGAPDANYGTGGSLAVKDGTGAGYDRLSYLRFPLSSIAGSVTQATLKVTVSSVATEGGGPKTIELRQAAADAWAETGTTWNNRPPSTGALIATFAPTAAGEVWSIDVTSYVNSQLADGKASFVLVQPVDVNRLVNFHSRESAANKPVLEFQ